MVGIAAERLRDDPLQLGLDLVDGLAGGEAGAVAHSEDVRVDRKRFLAESGVEDDVGGFSSHAGQLLQFLARARDLAAVIANQCLRQRDHIPGLGVEQADRLDLTPQRLFAQLDHLARGLHPREQRTRGDVDAGVRGLGREDDRNQQLIGIAGFELGGRGGVRLGEPAEEFEDLVALQPVRLWAPITSRIE